MTDSTPRPSGGDIHRLLDEAFAGVTMTPDAQDLKEEVRGNLLARVAELEAAGQPPADAARRAIVELGDVRELLGDEPGQVTHAETAQALFLRHRVRPKPSFVLWTAIYSVGLVITFAVALVSMTGVMTLPIGPTIALLGFGSTAGGLLVGSALSQETTTNHPMPDLRAGGYALATFLALYGLSYGALVLFERMPMWGIVFAVIGVAGSIILFVFLGATQTNRHKAWVRTSGYQGANTHVSNRFEEEPETAARFGIYSAVLWTVAFAAFIVLTFTVGWAWSWLALLGGFAVMMLLLARMLFGPRKT